MIHRCVGFKIALPGKLCLKIILHLCRLSTGTYGFTVKVFLCYINIIYRGKYYQSYKIILRFITDFCIAFVLSSSCTVLLKFEWGMNDGLWIVLLHLKFITPMHHEVLNGMPQGEWILNGSVIGQPYMYLKSVYPRKIKTGDPVVAAILPSHMEASYCTFKFFIAKPPKQFC